MHRGEEEIDELGYLNRPVSNCVANLDISSLAKNVRAFNAYTFNIYLYLFNGWITRFFFFSSCNYLIETCNVFISTTINNF